MSKEKSQDKLEKCFGMSENENITYQKSWNTTKAVHAQRKIYNFILENIKKDWNKLSKLPP